jgi:regulator of replication initiation timing
MVVILGLMYLTQITKTTAFGYEVDELKTTRAALIEENEQLEVESARLQALERIRTSDVAKTLSDVGSVEFTQ